MGSGKKKKDQPPIKALVVDDEKPITELFCQLLNLIGVESIYAFDGDTAYKMFKEEKPDIVFSDYVMPGMDGVALYKKIRAEKPDLPFVLFTGFFDKLIVRFMEETTETGDGSLLFEEPDFVMRKPFMKTEDIVDELEKVFPGRKFELPEED